MRARLQFPTWGQGVGPGELRPAGTVSGPRTAHRPHGHTSPSGVPAFLTGPAHRESSRAKELGGRLLNRLAPNAEATEQPSSHPPSGPGVTPVVGPGFASTGQAGVPGLALPSSRPARLTRGEEEWPPGAVRGPACVQGGRPRAFGLTRCHPGGPSLRSPLVCAWLPQGRFCLGRTRGMPRPVLEGAPAAAAEPGGQTPRTARSESSNVRGNI